MAELIDNYSGVPLFEEDRHFYYDWSAEEIFSLASRAEGECSAGLFDLIDWDFSNIEKTFLRIEGGDGTQDLLREIVLSASRALLITKGLEPKNETEAVTLFRDNFIGRHIDISYDQVIDKYLNEKEITLKEAKELSEAVKFLYNEMDDSLRFPELEAGMEPAQDKPMMETREQIFHDFRGIACPINFVKTKLVLETMEPGEQLRILLDDGEPINNVPLSVKAEGHTVLDPVMIDDYWEVVIEKGLEKISV